MASPVPFALRFTPQRGTSPVAVVCALGCDICGRNWPRPGLLEPSGCAEVVVDFTNLVRLPIARANSRQIHEMQVAGFAARASFPVRKKLRHACNDLHTRCTNLRWSPPGSSRGG